MKGQVAFTALSNLRDDLILEAAEVLGFLGAPTPVAGKPARNRRERENSLLYRFFNSGWGVVVICAVVSLSVLSGIIWAGQRPPAGGPGGTEPETETVDYTGDSQDEMMVKHGDTVIYPRRFFLWSSDGKVSADGLGFRDTIKQDYDGVPVLPKVYYAKDGSISPCELHLAKGYEFSHVRIYDTDMKQGAVTYDGSFNYKGFLSVLPVGRYYIALQIKHNSSCYEYAYELEVLDTTASGIISEEQAMQIASKYWGIQTGDVADNGFTFRIESQGTTQTPKGESVYRIALRWLVNLGNDSHYSTVDTVWVDVLTGEVIIPYAPPAETETEGVTDPEIEPETETDTETETEPHEHMYSEGLLVQSTCTQYGYIEFYCPCGYRVTIESESTPPTGHSFGSWQFAVAPTCTEGGVHVRTCALCNATEEKAIPAGLHIYGSESSCGACSQALSRNDTFLTFTSNGDGTCSVGCNADGQYLDPVLVLPNYSPDGDLVTAIEEGAFRGRFSSIHATTYFAGRYLTSVTLPAALETIGSYAFDWCEQLTEVIFPDTLRSMGEYAFHSTALTALALPEGVTAIDYYAFGDCLQLQSVYIPASVAEIGMYAFGGCRSLESIAFDEGSALTAIPPLFAEFCSSLTEIHLPDTVTHIGWSAFSDCTALTSIILPENLIEIGDGAFLNCQNLSSVKYPDSLTRVGWRPFRNTALTITRWEGCLYVAIGDNPYAILSYADESKEPSIRVHPDTRIIALAAFSDCRKLTELTYDGTMEEWSAIHHTIPEWPDALIRTIVCSDGNVTIVKTDTELP